eukprot:scaffold21370_cov67-Phaeocystis_antarctica.AAC.20
MSADGANPALVALCCCPTPKLAGIGARAACAVCAACAAACAACAACTACTACARSLAARLEAATVCQLSFGTSFCPSTLRPRAQRVYVVVLDAGVSGLRQGDCVRVPRFWQVCWLLAKLGGIVCMWTHVFALTDGTVCRPGAQACLV